jgi:hypothetical protein
MKHLRKYNEGYSEKTISEIITDYEKEISQLLEDEKDNIVERFKRGERDDSPFMPSANDNYMAGQSKGRLETLQQVVTKLKFIRLTL